MIHREEQEVRIVQTTNRGQKQYAVFALCFLILLESRKFAKNKVMIGEASASTQATKVRPRKIPESLVKETIDGVPFYYRGYRSVLNKTKKLEDIMADSGLQIFIKSWLLELLLTQMNRSKYRAFAGELGNHFDHGNNLALDVAIFEKSVLTADKINAKYVDVAPKIVIEVDVRVELEDRSADIFTDFVLRKVRKLHAVGTEKIIWIFTRSKTVIVARPGNTWDVLDWDTDIELLDGITFNVARHLKEEGINLDS